MPSVGCTRVDGQVLAVVSAEEFTLAPPIVLGDELIPARIRRAMAEGWDTGTFRHRDIRLVELEGVYVIGEGLVVSARGEPVAETITQHSPAQMTALMERFSTARAEARPVEGRNVLCRKRGDHNYGHWLLECLPKADIGFRMLDIDGILVPGYAGAIGGVIDDSLHMLGLDGGRVCKLDNLSPTFHERLVVVDGLTEHGSYMSPLALRHLERLRLGQPGSGAKLVYLARRGVPRRLSNEDGLCDALQRLGFTVVDTATLSLREQISALKDADVVVGAMGAAMTNVVFAHCGGIVVNLAPAVMPDTFFYFLAAHRGQRYVEIRCLIDDPSTGRASDFSICCDLVEKVLDEQWGRHWGTG